MGMSMNEMKDDMYIYLYTNIYNPNELEQELAWVNNFIPYFVLQNLPH